MSQEAELSGLSEDFLMTGQPTTMADQAYIWKNPDKVKALTELFKATGNATSQSSQAEKQDLLGLVDEALSGGR